MSGNTLETPSLNASEITTWIPSNQNAEIKSMLILRVLSDFLIF